MLSKWVICILLFLVAIASLIGVYETHTAIGTDPMTFAMQFGSTGGSLAILAFCVAVLSWKKQVISCMGKCEVCSK
jgi:uncharacterized membrane protein